MIRILHVVSVMDIGGMESFIMNMFRNIDRNRIQFDFLVHHRREGAFEKEIRSLGGVAHHTALMDNGNLFQYRRQLRTLFADHPEYRIVHGHLGSPAYWYLGEAERAGIPWRILHSHCPSHIHTLKGDIKHLLFYLSPLHANVRLACSEEAGRYQFKSKSFEVIPNGIEIARFRFNPGIRSEVRRQLGLEGRFVMGHVGRFYYEKNHAFLINVFRKVLEKAPESVLMLVGDGLLKQKAIEQAEKLGISDRILFLGLQEDPSRFYHAMDVFMLPSVYEGLPLVGIEAQCAGLPCLFSKGVSRETCLGGSAEFLPIEAGMDTLWADKILQIREKGMDRAYREEVPPSAQRFDIHTITGEMVRRYEEMLEQHP